MVRRGAMTSGKSCGYERRRRVAGPPGDRGSGHSAWLCPGSPWHPASDGRRRRAALGTRSPVGLAAFKRDQCDDNAVACTDDHSVEGVLGDGFHVVRSVFVHQRVRVRSAWPVPRRRIRLQSWSASAGTLTCCRRGERTRFPRMGHCRPAGRHRSACRMARSRGGQWLQGEVDTKCLFEFSHRGSGQPAYLLAYALDRD
jgi:hypothetical protein